MIPTRSDTRHIRSGGGGPVIGGGGGRRRRHWIGIRMVTKCLIEFQNEFQFFQFPYGQWWYMW